MIFFCGLHYIVGMADQAEAALKVYDKLLFGEVKVGSVRSNRGYSKGESGTLRLIRTVCKAIQAKGCEKSGRPVQFQTFLLNEKEIKEVPLAPFRGNRFNITFFNGAGVYFLYNHLLEFFEHVHTENRLLGAVFDDLQVKAFVAGCRALGLISKLVTGPLWRVLEDRNVHVLDMSLKYQHLLHSLEVWGKDAAVVLKGEVVLFEGYEVVKDQIFDKLVEPNQNFDVLTLQALELIFAAVVVKTKRLLADHLKGGKYEYPSEEMRKETESVMKTNVMPERDFGMLDRLIMEKPRATTIVLEGIIMFNKNETGVWRDKLPPEKRQMVMKLAQQSKEKQKALFAARQLEIRKQRVEKMEKAAAEEEKNAQKLRVKKQLLMDKIEKIGLWKTEQEVTKCVSEIEDECERVRVLSLQIQFRKVVLSAYHPDKVVFQMSAKGRKFNSERLCENLCTILKKAREEQEQEDPGPVPPLFPAVIAPNVLEQQKKLYRDEAEKQGRKTQAKRKDNFDTSQAGRKRRRTDDRIEVPVVHVPEDLVGKRVTHLCISDEDVDEDSEGSSGWYEGCVLSLCGRGKNPLFQIRYDGYDDIWTFRLMKHLQDGVLKLIPLTKEDLVGADILHRLKVGTSEEWFKGKVLGMVAGSDSNNPEFSVEYEEEYREDDEEEEEIEFDEEEEGRNSHVEDYPLIEDYLNGDLRLL